MKKMDYYIPLYQNNIYHIYNRGNGNEKIFIKEKNYYYFLHQFEKYLSDSLDTFAFCLIPNHFHLLVRIKDSNPELVSDKFRKFFISYSMAVNIQEKRKGNLFQRSFKRKIIEDEKYFYSAVYYIHANSVHHKLVIDLRQYPYCSFNELIGNNRTILCRNETMEWFGGKEKFIKYHIEMKNYFSEKFIIED